VNYIFRVDAVAANGSVTSSWWYDNWPDGYGTGLYGAGAYGDLDDESGTPDDDSPFLDGGSP
jgi:hypothetical protein